MLIGFSYQLVKDLVALSKMKESDPIDPGTLDTKDLVAMGILDGEISDDYSWSAPRRLFSQTEAPGATHEVVWVTDKLHRTKRKVVRLTRDGALDLILIHKKGG
jgi:hypothetical protein